LVNSDGTEDTEFEIAESEGGLVAVLKDEEGRLVPKTYGSYQMKLGLEDGEEILMEATLELAIQCGEETYLPPEIEEETLYSFLPSNENPSLTLPHFATYSPAHCTIHSYQIYLPDKQTLHPYFN